jgi:rod shape-determining protein MreC
VPLRGGNFRFSLIVYFVFATGLLFFGRAEAYVFERMRQVIDDATSPLYEFFGPPVDTARRAIANVFEIFSVYAENERLREENTKLKAWQERALTLEQQLAGYEALLDLPVDPDIAYRTGRVVNDPGGPFVRTLLINLGTNDGVAEGQAVVGAVGLAGRIVSAGPGASRILLVTDLNSRIPVKIVPRVPPTDSGSPAPPPETPAVSSASGTTAALMSAPEPSAPPSEPPDGLLIGENDAAPVVDFIHAGPGTTITLSPGDRVVTSGKDGLLPPHILVGVVKEVKGDRATIKLATNFDHLSYVRVLEYASPFAGVPRTGKGPALLNAHVAPVGAGGEAATVVAPAPAPPPLRASAKTPPKPLAAKPLAAKPPAAKPRKTPAPVAPAPVAPAPEAAEPSTSAPETPVAAEPGGPPHESPATADPNQPSAPSPTEPAPTVEEPNQ